MFQRIGDFVTQLLAGGTTEIVLLIVLVVIALVLLVLAVWLLWKLLVLLGKGILWLAGRAGASYSARSEARHDAALGEPPAVATGWSTAPRIRLRAALADARRFVGPDAFRIAIVDGKGMNDLCRGLDLSPPSVGKIGIAAGGDTVLVDASNADARGLRRLARAFPWRRPLDGVAVLVDTEGIPREAIVRAATLARATGFRTALHFVLPSPSDAAAWRIVDANNRNGDAICTDLAAETVRIWLSGGSREGLNELALAQSRNLPAALSRALAVAPSSVLDVASLCFGGVGLRGAVAQTVDRTRPSAVPGFLAWAGLALFVAGLALGALTLVVALDRARSLDALAQQAAREASVPWTAEGVDAVPSSARVRRLAGLGQQLAGMSEFSPLIPLAFAVPGNDEARRLGGAFLSGYVLRPLAATLERKSQAMLAPSDDPRAWVENARVVGEWLAAWEGLDDQPEEVDIQALLAGAFGGDRSAWPEGIDGALVEAEVHPPDPAAGGLDVDALRTLARANFIFTMQRWADSVYTNGPVATAARRAADRSATWRDQHAALVGLRTHLQDPSQQWLTAAEDRSDHSFELRQLGRALALAIVGQTTVVEAKAAVARIRIDARDAAEYFLFPEIGPLLVRSGSGSGPSLSMTPEVTAWLGFLDKIASAGFASLPREAAAPPVGPVTLDVVAAREARRRLQVFEQFASDLPTGLPPAIAQALVRELASELVVGVTVGVEQAMRLASDLGIASDRAERRAQVLPALGDLAEVEAWLGQRGAHTEVERVRAVRSRVSATVLLAATAVLDEEDPLDIPFDPAADSNAMVRRFERGLAHLLRIHEQLAQPFIEPAAQVGDWVVVEWKDMAADIEAHRRGDANANLSAIEGLVRAVSEDPEAACAAPRPRGVRDDYIARALSRIRNAVDRFCGAASTAEIAVLHERAKAYFDAHVAWQWPYANDDRAPELAASTLAAFLTELEPLRGRPPLPAAPMASLFADSLDFWTLDGDGRPAVRFRIGWRARRSEEELAEHIAEVRLIGPERDEEGVYTWRYGSPFAVRFRLAANSPWRFVSHAGMAGSDEWEVTSPGHGAFLRSIAEVASGGMLLFAREVTDTGSEDGATRTLRISARLSHRDGRAMELPRFAVPPRLRFLRSDAMPAGRN